MKRVVLILNLIIVSIGLFAQDELPYNPDVDAVKEIEAAVELAASQNQHVLLIVGGNWCPWCRKLDRYFKENVAVRDQLTESFQVVKVNYSKENKNEDILAEYGFPQRFGFPVLVVLDANGKRLHTQNTAYIEEDKGYAEKKVLQFLRNWNPSAIDPTNY